MLLRKLLERQEVIRTFGVAALLSPLVDNYISAFVLPRGPRSWDAQVFINMISSRTWMEQLLYLSSFLVGCVMLQGKPSSWKLVILLLGAQILNQILSLLLKPEVNSIATLFLLMNMTLFFLIARELNWERVKAAFVSVRFAPPPPTEPQKSSAPERPLASTKTQAVSPPRPQREPRVQVQKKVDVYFEGFGNWARLVDISKEGIHVRCVAPPPEGIDTREIEISMTNDLIIRIRLSKRFGSNLYFQYQDLTPAETQKLNQWLLRQAV